MMNDKFTFGKAITAVPPPPFPPLYTHIGGIYKTLHTPGTFSYD